MSGGGWGGDPRAATGNQGGGGGWGGDPRGATPAAPSAKPAASHHGSGGVWGFIQHAASDAYHAPEGMAQGFVTIGEGLAHDVTKFAEHPIGYNPKRDSELRRTVVMPLVNQYKQYYGPLAHGNVGGFLHNVDQHPLQLGLDLATVATLGAGAAAKVGLLSDEARALTVPDLAKQAGQGGEDVTIRMSSRNPLIRARQVAINNALNNASPKLPLVGSQARFARVIAGRALRDAASQQLKGMAFSRAFSRLSNPERVAWHLKMQQIDPQAYQDLLHEKAVESPRSTEAAMTKVLQDKHLNDAFHNPSGRLMDALTKGRALSRQMTEAKVSRGFLDEVQALERAYLPNRILSGGKFKPVMADASEKLLGQTKAHDTEIVGGKSVEELAHEIADKGEVQPEYVPHSAETESGGGRFLRPSSLNPPAKLGSMKRNEGTLFEKGMLNLHHDSLSKENRLFARYIGRTDVNAALLEHAAKEPAEGLPAGYEYLKTAAGQKSAPYTARAAGELKEALKVPEEQSLRDRFFTRNADDPGIATDGEGHRLIVPTKVADLLSPESQASNGLVRKILYNKPTSVWKHLVLGLRPAYFANIILSQHILGLLQSAPGEGQLAYLNHLIPGARLGKLTDRTVEDVFPEQAHGTFASTEGFTSNKGLSAGARAYQGVMPATLRAESWLRRLMIEGWAKSEPEVRAAMARHGGDINQALRDVAKSDPHVIEEISRRVDHAQGNYRNYSPAEQKIRQIIPFYGWDRHIVQSTYRLLAERPGTINFLSNVDRLGRGQQQKAFGALPSYLRDLVALHGLPRFMGKVPAGDAVGFSAKSLSPFQTDSDIMRTIGSLVHGQAGTSPEEADNINPLLAAFIEQTTGRNLATGAKLKDHLPFGYANIPIRAALDLPQARLVEQMFGKHPLGRSKHPVSNPDWRFQLASLLGIPVTEINKANAHYVASLQGKPPK